MPVFLLFAALVVATVCACAMAVILLGHAMNGSPVMAVAGVIASLTAAIMVWVCCMAALGPVWDRLELSLIHI